MWALGAVQGESDGGKLELLLIVGGKLPLSAEKHTCAAAMSQCVHAMAQLRVPLCLLCCRGCCSSSYLRHPCIATFTRARMMTHFLVCATCSIFHIVIKHTRT